MERIKQVGIAFTLHWAVLLVGICSPLRNSVSRLTLTRSIADSLIQWDAQWFVNIAKYGYVFPLSAQLPFMATGNTVPFSPPYKAAAFFPELPLLIHVLGASATVVLINALFALCLWLMYVLISGERSDLAFASIMLFAVNPCSIFFSALYTETLTLLGVLLICFGLRRPDSSRCFALSCVGALVAAGVHDLGVFSAVFAIRFIRLRMPMRALCFLVCAALPPAAYEWYLFNHFHTPLALIAAEGSWNRSWRPPFVNLVHTIAHGALSLNTIFILGMVVLALWQIGRSSHRDRAWRLDSEQQQPIVFSLETACWTACILLLGLCAYIPKHPLMSVLRFFCVLWPVYIPACTRAGTRENRCGQEYDPATSGRPEQFAPFVYIVGGSFCAYAAIGSSLFSHGWFFQ
ncbi:mannosyltransferase family protein [Alicyclobacillus acidiphilus]|uniref:mannosyltransferase family protein n=1 Tax=Alicyclobacillus acidiphilus TaxID=182455 RepID=UPI00146FFE6B|nr:mannosyltransferase family protein [Alicyclobacillus acidiphilus]